MSSVSVVIPAFNAERYIAPTIRSVEAQEIAGDIEIIVVDDGSTDRTVAEVERARGCLPIVFLTQQRRGVSAARNAGLAAARFEYVVFLDADDLFTPGALAVMTRVLDGAPQAVAALCGHEKIDEDGNRLDGHRRPATLPKGDTLDGLLRKNFVVNGGALCIRTAAARRAGGYDERLSFGEDWEFWCRLARLGNFADAAGFVALRYRQRLGGASHTLRGSPFHPNFTAVDAMFVDPAIARKYGRLRTWLYRRQARQDVYWTAARSELRHGHLLTFGLYLGVGAIRFPDSVLRVRLVARFLKDVFNTRRPAEAL